MVIYFRVLPNTQLVPTAAVEQLFCIRRLITGPNITTRLCYKYLGQGCGWGWGEGWGGGVNVAKFVIQWNTSLKITLKTRQSWPRKVRSSTRS